MTGPAFTPAMEIIMKQSDWNGHRIPVLAHAYSLAKGVSADVYLRAANEEEAMARLNRKLECRQDFLKATGGVFDVQWLRQVASPVHH